MAFWLRYKKKLTTVKYQITCKVQPKSSDQNNSNIKKNHSMHKGYSRLLEHFFTLFPRPELKLDLRAVNFFSWPVSLLHSIVVLCHKVGKFFE